MRCIAAEPARSPPRVVCDEVAQWSQANCMNGATAADERAGRLGWRRTWAKANPSLDLLPSPEEAIRREWNEAQGDPWALATFKALRLNMGVADTAEALVISVDTWLAAEGDVGEAGRCV